MEQDSGRGFHRRRYEDLKEGNNRRILPFRWTEGCNIFPKKEGIAARARITSAWATVGRQLEGTGVCCTLSLRCSSCAVASSVQVSMIERRTVHARAAYPCCVVRMLPTAVAEERGVLRTRRAEWAVPTGVAVAEWWCAAAEDLCGGWAGEECSSAAGAKVRDGGRWGGDERDASDGDALPVGVLGTLVLRCALLGARRRRWGTVAAVAAHAGGAGCGAEGRGAWNSAEEVRTEKVGAVAKRNAGCGVRGARRGCGARKRVRLRDDATKVTPAGGKPASHGLRARLAARDGLKGAASSALEDAFLGLKMRTGARAGRIPNEDVRKRGKGHLGARKESWKEKHQGYRRGQKEEPSKITLIGLART
ncbi:hypothetical protein C8J57DRAFT_1234292 [Mycena rebaudengoi]|nr:hypothetical protein C8J57DRAFT_1234292 [Mycena rebaudengoi]